MASKVFDNAVSRVADNHLSGVAALALQKVAANRLPVAKPSLDADIFPSFQALIGARVYGGTDNTAKWLATARIAPDAVLDTLIPDMAALIGEQWLSDEMSWANVTIVSARLQSLAWRYIEPMMARVSIDGDTPKVLMVSPEGETHTLGCVLAIGALIREGVDASGVFGEANDHVFGLVADGTYDAIGVSTSGCVGKELLSQLITGLSEQAPDAVLAIGGPIAACSPSLLEELKDASSQLRSESLTTLLQTGLTQGRTSARAGSSGSFPGHTRA